MIIINPLRDLPLFDNEVEDGETKLLVPSYRQLNNFSCGAVSAYSVVRTFHPKVSYEKVSRDCNPSVDEGAGVPELVRALRRNRVGVSERWGLTFKDIASAIERGFPLIVGERTDDPDSGHWVVIYGIGRRPNRIFTCGQTNVVALSGRKMFTWSEWRKRWDEYGLGLICWGE